MPWSSHCQLSEESMMSWTHSKSLWPCSKEVLLHFIAIVPPSLIPAHPADCQATPLFSQKLFTLSGVTHFRVTHSLVKETWITVISRYFALRLSQTSLIATSSIAVVQVWVCLKLWTESWEVGVIVWLSEWFIGMRTSLYPVMPLSLANLTAKCSENRIDECVDLDSSFSHDMSSNVHAWKCILRGYFTRNAYIVPIEHIESLALSCC